MEITTSPHRPASTPWGRLVALVVILAPVTALVLLPIGLGLQRWVAGHRFDWASGKVQEVTITDVRA